MPLTNCETVEEFGYEPKVGKTHIYIDYNGDYFFIDFETQKRIKLDYE